MQKNSLIVGLSIVCALASVIRVEAQHEHHDHGSHAVHAYGPAGVMGDHVHAEGDWMVSYRYMFMEMDGNRDGTDRVGVSEVLANFMVAPEEMTMQMHMLGGMYAPSEALTLMIMAPYVEIEMDHVTRMGRKFTTESDGIGDLKAAALYRVKQWGNQAVHLNVGMSLPTGSIDEKDMTPMGHARLPYPMQIGSGTYDLLPGLTYVGQEDALSWGSQLIATIRLGENDNDYTLGDRIAWTTWGEYKVTDAVGVSLRTDLQSWSDVDGADPRLSPMVVPTADPDRRGGTRLDILAGLSVYCPAGHRVAVEVGAPVYQDLNGPQLETDLLAQASWQYPW